MKYLYAETGQSLQLFHPDEVRPLERGPFLPDVIARTAARYHFVNPPTGLPAEGGLKFEAGKMVLTDVEISIGSLELYRDGIIVNTRHTNDSDAVIDDFFTWIVSTFGFRLPERRIARHYTSVVIVDIETPLDAFLSKFQILQQIVSDAYSQTRGERREFHLAQFTLTPSLSEPQRDFFRLEIRTATPFVPNRYFSNAPLPTNAHLDMLAELERAIVAT
jgi:hypothetical protein